jgi:hypothetical protein
MHCMREVAIPGYILRSDDARSDGGPATIRHGARERAVHLFHSQIPRSRHVRPRCVRCVRTADDADRCTSQSSAASTPARQCAPASYVHLFSRADFDHRSYGYVPSEVRTHSVCRLLPHADDCIVDRGHVRRAVRALDSAAHRAGRALPDVVAVPHSCHVWPHGGAGLGRQVSDLTSQFAHTVLIHLLGCGRQRTQPSSRRT